MKWFFVFVILQPLDTFACSPIEIHIREQWVNEYEKEDGTKVSAHYRSEHCRKITGDNYFQDSSSKKYNRIKNFKKWKESEKSLLNKKLEELPPWLKKYKLTEILRADGQEGNPANPAMTIPATKTLIIFDNFFKVSNKREIIIHELAHVASWDVDPDILKSFFLARDWKYREAGKIVPPEKIMIPDSQNSPSEDFANSVELYYSDRSRLKNFNLKSFQILEEIIQLKENYK